MAPLSSGMFGKRSFRAATSTLAVERSRRSRSGVSFVLPYDVVSESESSLYVCELLSYIRFLTHG